MKIGYQSTQIRRDEDERTDGIALSDEVNRYLGLVKTGDEMIPTNTTMHMQVKHLTRP